MSVNIFAYILKLCPKKIPEYFLKFSLTIKKNYKIQ